MTAQGAMYGICMRIIPVQSHRRRLVVFVCALLMSPFAVSRGMAQSDNQTPGAEKPSPADKGPAAKPPSEKDKDELPPLPPEKSAQQTMVLDGKTMHYT